MIMGKTGLTWKIASTHLWSKKRQTFLSVLGVTFGIAVYVFQSGLITGLQSFFIEKTINSTANVHIYSDVLSKKPSIVERKFANASTMVFLSQHSSRTDDPKLKNGFQILKSIETHPEVSGASPYFSSQVIFKKSNIQVAGYLAGVDIDKEDKLFDITSTLTVGQVSGLKSVSNGVILGNTIAENLGAELNDRITVISPLGVVLEMKVIGISKSGLTKIDATRGFCDIRNAQKLMRKDGNYITDINIKLKNIDRAEQLALDFQDQYGYKAEDWKVANASTLSIFKVQNMVTYMVIVSILVVSGFGIFNILMMMIYEKMSDIAILKSIGLRSRDILSIFLAEAMVIGLIGGFVGLIAGYFLSRLVGSIPIKIEGIVSVDHLMISYSPSIYISAFVFALVSTAAAGYFPARKASKIDPVVIIRSK